MTRIVLPDCAHYEEDLSLSAEDRRELVRRIAEKGADAIDEFIREREAQGDSTIARKIQKLREELVKRAEELKRRLIEDFGEKEAALEAEYRARLAVLESERAGLQSQLARVGPDLDAALRGDARIAFALSHDVVARPPWWRRALAGLARALRWLLLPLAWLWRALFGKRRARADRRVGVLVPSGAGAPILDQAGALYLADPTFRQAVRAKLREAPAPERLRMAWERLIGLEDYESLARKAMQLMLEEDAARAKADADAKQDELQRKLAETLARERDAQAARERDEAALREAAEREARAIEEALRSAPEREVKEAIVDELKASGILRESEGKLAPTLQLLERFAGLVYEDETRSLGAGGAGVAGDYAEGEGHYVRGPMRMAVEASRMDIPASLLRARSRHPRVRHLTDDDVVVYREERTSVLHVVLVVDRSGSMEENGRIEAAKRAALALHHAVRARNPRNRVDILLMDTSVRAATLRDVWETQPRGFTNHGAALRLAREMARRRKSDRLLVYVVTDGLPEAYTEGGVDKAGHPDKAMAFAKEQAKLLRREPGLAGFVMLLLEPKDERFVKAAKELAKACDGRVMDVDPQALARELVRSFEMPERAV